METEFWTAQSTFAVYYTSMSAMFYSTVWWVFMNYYVNNTYSESNYIRLARLSILLTIIRINPEQRRRPLFAVVILFIVLPAVLIGQAFWVCNPQQTLCQPGQQIAILKLVCE